MGDVNLRRYTVTASNIVAESLNSVKGLGAECTEDFPELIIIFSYEFKDCLAVVG